MLCTDQIKKKSKARTVIRFLLSDLFFAIKRSPFRRFLFFLFFAALRRRARLPYVTAAFSKIRSHFENKNCVQSKPQMTLKLRAKKKHTTITPHFTSRNLNKTARQSLIRFLKDNSPFFFIFLNKNLRKSVQSPFFLAILRFDKGWIVAQTHARTPSFQKWTFLATKGFVFVGWNFFFEKLSASDLGTHFASIVRYSAEWFRLHLSKCWNFEIFYFLEPEFSTNNFQFRFFGL